MISTRRPAKRPKEKRYCSGRFVRPSNAGTTCADEKPFSRRSHVSSVDFDGSWIPLRKTPRRQICTAVLFSPTNPAGLNRRRHSRAMVYRHDGNWPNTGF